MKGDPPAPPGSGPAWLSQRRLFVALALMFAGTWLWRTYLSEPAAAPIAYSQFYALLADGKVQSVAMSGDALDATLKSPETVAGRALQTQTVHTTAAPNDPALLPLLRQKGVQINVNGQQQSWLVQLMISLLPWALVIGFWVWMSRRAKTMLGAGNPFTGMLKNQSRKFDKATSVNVTFDDIAGLKAAKRDLQEVVQFLKQPDRFQRLGGKVPRGVLLIGPPGTGKTLLARAVAGESGVAFYSISASEFIEMFVGLGAARVRDLFRDAKKSAPAIVFIDEIDAVGRARGAGLGGGNDEREQTLNQLLSEMDGFDRTDLVVVIAATNRPDVLDPALLRPGRFDRRVLVDRPEVAARQAILDVHAKGKPLALDVNLQVVAQNTPGFSGADLANLVNEAALSATREGRESITTADFTEAFDKIVLGDPREAKLDAKEKRRVAIHEAGHAVVAAFSPETEPPHRVSILPRITLAQDPESAKYGEMPRNAVNAGVVDTALAIPDLARELVRLSRHPYVAAGEAPRPAGEADVRNQVLMVVRNAFGVDFSEYKSSTVERRLARRMALRRAQDVRAYLALVQGDPEEARALYEDILIHVTSFFRDPPVFEALSAQILPAILKDKPDGAPVRIWVAGCSTGEEVYSIAIALLELLEGSSRPVQIFGSDLSEPIIAKARAGIYADASLREVSEERRRRYFVKTDRGYRINKAVRDVCVFVQHDLARDPPFSKLDLVSCRNVLIYFDQALQKRIIPSLHYALNQRGYLLLGHTENISGFAQLFSIVDKENKVFVSTALPSTLRFAPRFDPRRVERPVTDPDTRTQVRGKMDVAKHLDRMLLARYAPPGVLINERMEILQFRGQTGSFLQPAPGDPQNDVIKMARPGLISALRAAVAQVKKDMAPAMRSGVEVDQDGLTRWCNLVVLPFTGYPEVLEPLYVVLFEEAEPDAQGSPPREATPARRRPPAPPAEDRRLPRLEHELVATKEYLQSLIEEHGRTNDDLGSANEELVSGNEELQSMNEELETAKEELQSTNEELTTVNDELQSRNQEVVQINSDLLNLLATVDLPIVILDRERRIRRFTPKARSILNVVSSDLGRPLDDIKANVDVPDLDRQVAAVIDTMAMTESEVQDRDGHWYRMQIRAYKTTDNKIDGAILSLVDIDALKHLVNESQQARGEAERANLAKDLFLAVLGHELRTPLASLLLQAQMLRRGKGVDPAKLIRVGEVIERATRMQMQLVDDLVDVSRIVAGKLKVELGVVDLPAVVKAAIDGVSGPIQRKSLDLDVVLDRFVGAVAGDAARLQQVVSNLLTNAIKFSSDHGHIAVTLEKANGCARIRVSDTGAGIEPEFLPHVFDRFSQADTSNTRMYGGLGLGLAIVRHLVEQHGGMIQAESPGAGKGATFSVTLPLMNVQRVNANAGAIAVSAGAIAVAGG